jgi:hypothetical protein
VKAKFLKPETMNAEQKAKELVDKFYEVVDDNRFSSRDWGKATAKQSALICVDEIMKVRFMDKEVEEYWQQVKENIQINKP